MAVWVWNCVTPQASEISKMRTIGTFESTGSLGLLWGRIGHRGRGRTPLGRESAPLASTWGPGDSIVTFGGEGVYSNTQECSNRSWRWQWGNLRGKNSPHGLPATPVPGKSFHVNWEERPMVPWTTLVSFNISSYSSREISDLKCL